MQKGWCLSAPAIKKPKSVVVTHVRDVKYVCVSFPLNAAHAGWLSSLHLIWHGHTITYSLLHHSMRCRLKAGQVRGCPLLASGVSLALLAKVELFFFTIKFIMCHFYNDFCFQLWFRSHFPLNLQYLHLCFLCIMSWLVHFYFLLVAFFFFRWPEVSR